MLLLLFTGTSVTANQVTGVGSAAGVATVTGISAYLFSFAITATLNDLAAVSSATLNDVTAPSSATLNDVTAPSSATLFETS